MLSYEKGSTACGIAKEADVKGVATSSGDDTEGTSKVLETSCDCAEDVCNASKEGEEAEVKTTSTDCKSCATSSLAKLKDADDEKDVTKESCK